MPIYEFVCDRCHCEFEELIFGNDTPPCPQCRTMQTHKLMSRPCRCKGSDGGGGEESAYTGGSGCAGCSGGNCASCH